MDLWPSSLHDETLLDRELWLLGVSAVALSCCFLSSLPVTLFPKAASEAKLTIFFSKHTTRYCISQSLTWSHCVFYYFFFLRQMTVRRRPAVWRWPTASPPWSRGSRCRRMRSSCWSPLWLTWFVGSTCRRSSRPWGHAEGRLKVTNTLLFFLKCAYQAKELRFLHFSTVFSLISYFALIWVVSLLWLVANLLLPSPPPLSPLLPDFVVFVKLCRASLCVDPALMRKSTSADSNVGKSGRLTV